MVEVSVSVRPAGLRLAGDQSGRHVVVDTRLHHPAGQGGAVVELRSQGRPMSGPALCCVGCTAKRTGRAPLLLGVGLICVILALLFVAASAALPRPQDPLHVTGGLRGRRGPTACTPTGRRRVPAPGSLTGAGVGSRAAGTCPPSRQRPGWRITIVSARAADRPGRRVELQARSRRPSCPMGGSPGRGFTITATGSARMTTTQ